MIKAIKEYSVEEIFKALIKPCDPYGSESYDSERYSNLLYKINLIEQLVDEVIDAGRLYNRHEYSILRISNKANESLATLRDLLCEIEYLPPREEIEEDE